MIENRSLPWSFDQSTGCFSRPFTGYESWISLLNAAGDAVVYLGATVKLDSPIALDELTSRANSAWLNTRFHLPLVATRVVKLSPTDRDPVLQYPTGNEEAWLKRTLIVSEPAFDWRKIRYQLSVITKPIPRGEENDCVLVYVIPPPAKDIQEFNILVVAHHAVTDGIGMQVITDGFLTSFALNLPPNARYDWSTSSSRLLPAKNQCLSDAELETLATKGEESLIEVTKKWTAPDPSIGLKIYAPNPAPGPSPTLTVSHTFPDAVLGKLLAVARSRGFTVTQLIDTAMKIVVYKWSPEDQNDRMFMRGMVPFDGRRAFREEYKHRSAYGGLATFMAIIQIPRSIFTDAGVSSETDGKSEKVFWKVARGVKHEWDNVKNTPALISLADTVMMGFVNAMGGSLNATSDPNAVPATNPFLVADANGLQQMNPFYPFTNGKNNLHLISYQICLDTPGFTQMCPRFHSWGNKLVLSIDAAEKLYPLAEIEEFMSQWVSIITDVSEYSIPNSKPAHNAKGTVNGVHKIPIQERIGQDLTAEVVVKKESSKPPKSPFKSFFSKERK